MKKILLIIAGVLLVVYLLPKGNSDSTVSEAKSSIGNELALREIKKEPKVKEAILTDAQKESVKKVFEDTLQDKQKIVAVEAMSPDELPAIVTQNEFMRRMSDMSKTGGGGMGMFGAMPNTYNITINANHPLISKLADLKSEDEQKALAKQISDLALLSQNLLTGSDLTAFIKRTVGGF